MMRQIGKQILTIAAWLALVALAHADGLVTTIVTDPLSGVAIDGYDAVTYFTDTDPQPGKPDFEYYWGGVPWYFESAANRDVFIHNPGVYAPQYGGHCLISLSRGYLSDGKPRLYVIDGLKLYLFYSTANRDAFLLSKVDALTAAAANWQKLSASLAGPQAPIDTSSSAPADAASASVAPPEADGNLAPTDSSSETPHG